METFHTLYAKALDSLQSEDAASAVETLLCCTRRYPSETASYTALPAIYTTHNLTSELKDSCLQVVTGSVARFPDVATLALSLSRMLQSQGKMVEAAEVTLMGLAATQITTADRIYGASQLRSLGHVDQAKKQISLLLPRLRGDWRYFNFVVEEGIALGMHDDIILKLKALSERRRSSQVLFALGKCHFAASSSSVRRNEELTKAIQAFSEAVSLNGRLTEAVEKIGEALFFLQRYAEASNVFSHLLRYFPANTAHKVWLAASLLYSKNLLASQALLIELTESEPDNYKHHYYLARCYTGQRDYPKAASSIDKALALNPSDYRSHYQTSFIYEALGLLAESEAHYLQYLHLKLKSLSDKAANF